MTGSVESVTAADDRGGAVVVLSVIAVGGSTVEGGCDEFVEGEAETDAAA